MKWPRAAGRRPLVAGRSVTETKTTSTVGCADWIDPAPDPSTAPPRANHSQQGCRRPFVSDTGPLFRVGAGVPGPEAGRCSARGNAPCWLTDGVENPELTKPMATPCPLATSVAPGQGFPMVVTRLDQGLALAGFLAAPSLADKPTQPNGYTSYLFVADGRQHQQALYT